MEPKGTDFVPTKIRALWLVFYNPNTVGSNWQSPSKKKPTTPVNYPHLPL